MRLLTFITGLLRCKPAVGAPIEGLWRLERTRMLDSTGRSELSFVRDPYDPEIDYLDVRPGKAAFFTVCGGLFAGTLSVAGREGAYHPFAFDPHSGTLLYGGVYYRVERLSATLLVLLDLAELGRGTVVRCFYRRMGRREE